MTTFESFGAVGDGITDDRDAIYNALNSGESITAPKGKVYYIGSSIEITGKDINIEGRAFFLFKNTASIKFNGTADVFDFLAVDTLVDDEYFEVTDATGFVVGALISITTDLDYSWPYHPDDNYHNGELHEIDHIVGNKIYVKDKVWTAWDVDLNNPVTGNPQIIKVYQFLPITVLITGLIFKYETPQDITGFTISYAKNNILNNVVMHDSQTIGIMFHYCYNNKFWNGAVCGSNSFVGNGYGLRFQCSNINDVYNSKFLRNWKSIENSSSPPTAYDYGRFPTRSTTVRNCKGRGYGLATNGQTLFEIGSLFVNTHATAQNIIVRNNTIEGFYTIFNCVGIDSEFYENTITGLSQHVVTLIYGKNYKVYDNTFNGVIGQYALLQGIGGSFVCMIDLHSDGNVEITGNDVRTAQLYFLTAGGTLDVNNVKNENNTVRFANTPCWVFNKKSRLPGIVETAGNTYIGGNVNETKD